MSVNGIRLESQPQVQYFHPILREYYQSMRDAVAPDNFSADQQAFARLRKPPQTAAPEQSVEVQYHISEKAPAGGDVSGTAPAPDGLQQNVQSMSEPQAQQQEAGTNNGNVSPEGGGNPDTGTHLNLNV